MNTKAAADDDLAYSSVDENEDEPNDGAVFVEDDNYDAPAPATVNAVWVLGASSSLGSPGAPVAGTLGDVAIVSIAAGASHVLALNAAGAVFAWGEGGDGQLGNYAFTAGCTSKAERILGELEAEHVSSIACGTAHSVALTSGGKVFTWGAGSRGQLGLGNFNSQSKPCQVLPMNITPVDDWEKAEAEGTACVEDWSVVTPIVQIACGPTHTAALSASGPLYTWGDGRDGRLGHEDTRDHGASEDGQCASFASHVIMADPILKMGKKIKVATVGCFTDFCFAIGTDGELFTWGCGAHGRLGHRGDANLRTARAISTVVGHTGRTQPFTEKVKQFACGARHALLLTTTGQVYAWGDGSAGQLGGHNLESSEFPQEVRYLGDEVVAIAAGAAHSVALTKGGDVYAWGLGEHGQLGRGDYRTLEVPCRVMELLGLKVTAIQCGAYHTCALTLDGRKGTLWTWGKGGGGQLGHEPPTPRSSPSPLDQDIHYDPSAPQDSSMPKPVALFNGENSMSGASICIGRCLHEHTVVVAGAPTKSDAGAQDRGWADQGLHYAPEASTYVRTEGTRARWGEGKANDDNVAPTAGEQIEAMGPEQADAIMRALDVNGDGFITLAEAESYLMARSAWSTKEEVAELLGRFDANKDGKITREELVQGLTEHSSSPPPLERLMALRPPPAGPKVFDELVRAGGLCRINKAEERAISLGQLKATFRHASRRCVAEGWLGKRPNLKKDGEWKRSDASLGLTKQEATNTSAWCYEALVPDTINLYDLAAHVILPATHSRVLPRTGSLLSRLCGGLCGGGASLPPVQPSFVELLADGPQPPDYFVSHFWGEEIKDFIACLAQHTRDRSYGGGMPSVKRCTAADADGPAKFEISSGADGDAGRFWVCAYANRQWDIAGDVTDDPTKTSFHKAIVGSLGVISIVDRAGRYFTRVWCDYEISVAIRFAEQDRSDPALLDDMVVNEARRADSVRHAGLAETGRPPKRSQIFPGDKSDDEPKTPPFTYDVYTALSHDSLIQEELPGMCQGGEVNMVHNEVPRLEAVGLTDGVVACDRVHTSANYHASMKRTRECHFPADILQQGLAARVQDGQASVAADVQRILNTISRNPADKAPLAEHSTYDDINVMLHAKIAASGLVNAVARRGELLDNCLMSFALSKTLKTIDATFDSLSQGIDFQDLVRRGEVPETDEAREERITPAVELWDRVLDTLPTSLESLSLSKMKTCDVFTRLAKLSQLRSLRLNDFATLHTLPDLSALTALTNLDLDNLPSLRTVPDLSCCTQLRDINLYCCSSVYVLPDMSMLHHLYTLLLVGCKDLTCVPSVPPSLFCLSPAGCDGLRYMPKVSASTYIRWYEHLYGDELPLQFLEWEEGGREPFWVTDEHRVLYENYLAKMEQRDAEVYDNTSELVHKTSNE